MFGIEICKISYGDLNCCSYLQMFASWMFLPRSPKRGARLSAYQLLLDHEISLMLVGQAKAS